MLDQVDPAPWLGAVPDELLEVVDDPQFSGGIASREVYGPNKPNAATSTTIGLAFTLETCGKRDARLRAAKSNVRLTEATVAGF